MFLPLHDGVSLKFLSRPLATWALISTNIVIFAILGSRFFGDVEKIELSLGVIPAVLFDHAALAKGLEIVPAPVTLLTSLFLHGGFMHLAGNMLFLWVFGDNVEDAMGSARFVGFYLLAGIGASLFYASLDPNSQSPLIGASGAIAGVIAAYLVLYPNVRVFGLALQYIPIRIRAVWCLGFWFLFQVFAAITTQDSNVGWWAHVGGFVVGTALTPFLKRKDVPLFGPRIA